ncbi:MAG: CU044_5270 family protein [Actinomycetota bacterium]|nr:CU044_5270 family protein [Actinomycetota bacterium]
MTANTDLELIRDLHPEQPASPTAREHARARLMLELEHDGKPATSPRLLRGRFAVWPSIGLVGALCAVAAGLLLAGGLRGGVEQPASASAAALLRRAALAAEAAGGPRQMRPGEYWYVHSHTTTLGVAVAGRQPHHALVITDALGSLDRQIWVGLDTPSQLQTRVIGPIKFLSASARRDWERAGRPAQLNSPGDLPLPPNAFDIPYAQLLRLPTNVDAMRRVIAGRTGRSSTAFRRHEMFTIIGDLVREDPVPARVRAALYRVAATIPGIKMLGRTHDGIGRPALAVVLDDPFDHQRDELLFDPHTAKLLGESQIILKPNKGFRVKPGTLLFESTYLSSGIVKRIPSSVLSSSEPGPAQSKPVQIGRPGVGR